jgi:hypothetical protein
VDLDRSAASRHLVITLERDETVALWEDPSEACPDQPCAVDTVTRTIEAERAKGALIVQLGFGADPHSNQGARIDLFSADADPIGAFLLERSVVDALAERRPSRDDLRLHHAVVGTAGSTRVVRGMLSGLLVVFLLFTAAGASGWLIEEEQQATLSLLLTTRAGLGRILGSQWLFLLSLGSLQATLMVLWATMVFGLAWTGLSRSCESSWSRSRQPRPPPSASFSPRSYALAHSSAPRR